MRKNTGGTTERCLKNVKNTVEFVKNSLFSTAQRRKKLIQAVCHRTFAFCEDGDLSAFGET